MGTIEPMTEITLVLEDSLALKLESQAEKQGLSVSQLLEREVARIAKQDPFGFFDSGTSNELRGTEIKQQLHETNFGE